MNFWGNSRKLYLIAAAMVVTAVVLLTFGSTWSKPAGQAADPALVTPCPTQSATALPEISPTAGVNSASATKKMSTVVYYQDDSGYLVPVMRSVPMQQGVAKATLSLMVKSQQNDMDAARMGLRTVLPEGCDFEIDISAEGIARIDLSEEALSLADAAAEENMVQAIVQTLTEFDSVKGVQFLFAGRERTTLPQGTAVSGTFARMPLNPETTQSASGNAVQLYFPCSSGNVIVPVTRQVYGNADVPTAVLELAKGPAAAGALEPALPAGCGIISARIENGVAMIDFTSEFIRLAENSDGGRMALKALVLTCTQFEGVDSVQLFVEGEPYDPGAATLAVPTFMNIADDIVSTYIQSQTALIFDFE